MSTSVACVGQGFVGGSLTTVLSERGIDVYPYDKAGKYANGAKFVNVEQPSSIHDLLLKVGSNVENFSNVCFVCLPTPMFQSGECDTSIVEGALAEISKISSSAGQKLIAIVKSTVPPGSCAKWNSQFKSKNLSVVFCPEFLTEKNCLSDMRNQNRIILGGDQQEVDEVAKLFNEAFPTVPVYKTSSTNAELVKYVANTFLATKVSFANEIYQLCQKLSSDNDVSYDEIVKLAVLDDRLGKSHWQVPGPMPADDGSGKLVYGFGGSCFCKDINAIIYLMKQIGLTPTMLQATWDKNLEVRPEHDWEKLVGRAVAVVKK